MVPSSCNSLLALQEEGMQCKASLRAFTEDLIGKLGLSRREAEWLRRYDASRGEGNVYLYFPFCFREVFTTVALEDIRTLALSGILWMSYMRARDDTIDESGTADPTLLFLRDLYLRESLHLLYKLFPYSSRFWIYYSRYFDEYARAVLCERGNHSSVNSKYDLDDFHSIAKGKAAMAKYPVAAQAVLCGQEEKMAALTDSLECYYVGYQYWDDLMDWKEDLANSRYSLLLARALEHLSQENRTISDQLREQVARVIYYSGLAIEHLDRSFEWSERAYGLSLTAGCTIWAAHIKTLLQRIAVLKSDLSSMISEKRAELTASQPAALKPSTSMSGQ
jgi:hypothetical protein